MSVFIHVKDFEDLLQRPVGLGHLSFKHLKEVLRVHAGQHFYLFLLFRSVILVSLVLELYEACSAGLLELRYGSTHPLKMGHLLKDSTLIVDTPDHSKIVHCGIMLVVGLHHVNKVDKFAVVH